MNHKKKIIVIGSCNTDMVVKSERLPLPGETILGGDFFMNPGGKGANQAVAAARLGADTTLVCKVGEDLFGSNAIAIFEKEGINTSFIYKSSDKPSGIALINVDKNGENCIAVASGANGELSVDDIKSVKKEIEEASYLLLQLEIPVETVLFAAKLAYEAGTKVILNPAPAPKSPLPEELFKYIDIIIPNETETQLITNVKITDIESAETAMNKILDKGVKNIIITMGSRGAVTQENNELIHIPAYKVKAIDTTAAGDTFCGALCVGLTDGLSLCEAIKFASKASSISVTRMGAQSSMPYRKELE